MAHETADADAMMRFGHSAPTPPILLPRKRGTRSALRAVVSLLVALAGVCIHAAVAAPRAPSTLDDFESVAGWTADHTDDTTASIASADGKFGRALRLDFDFRGVIGYATARRALALDLPADYELSFWVRGEAPVNALEFKLIDASGENVWWVNREAFAFPHE